MDEKFRSVQKTVRGQCLIGLPVDFCRYMGINNKDRLKIRLVSRNKLEISKE